MLYFYWCHIIALTVLLCGSQYLCVSDIEMKLNNALVSFDCSDVYV